MDLYGAADWRYGQYPGFMATPIMEPGTAAMEAITAVADGPLCILAALADVRGYTWLHPVRLIVCTMQIYGLVWFILEPIFGGGMASHFPEDPFLFWGIAVGCNAPWGIVPPILWVQSWTQIMSALRFQEENKKAKLR